jgi:hypothetical protein
MVGQYYAHFSFLERFSFADRYVSQLTSIIPDITGILLRQDAARSHSRTNPEGKMEPISSWL